MRPIQSFNSRPRLTPDGKIEAPVEWLTLPKVGHNARLVVHEQPEVTHIHGVQGLVEFYRESQRHGMNVSNPWLPTQPMED